MLDLNGFKQINDSHGHVVGDQMLQKVAQRLTTVMRSTDAVARLGGDEFAIIAENIKSPADLEIVARNILEGVNHPFDMEFGELSTGISVGGAIYPDSAEDNESLLVQADNAMYHAKQNGMGYFIFNDAALVKAMSGGEKREIAFQNDVAQNDVALTGSAATSILILLLFVQQSMRCCCIYSCSNCRNL